MRGGILVVAVAAVAIGACGSSEETQDSDSDRAIAESGATTAPQQTAPAREAGAVAAAENAARVSKPDAPIWKHATYTGTVVSDTEICVTQKLSKKDAELLDGERYSQIIVTFPHRDIGEAEDGKCGTKVEPITASEPTKPSKPAPPSDPHEVNRASFEGTWPLTVSSGRLNCEGSDGFGPVTFAARGITYTVNGTAKSQKPDLPEIEEIWKSDPDIPGAKINISDLIDAGLKLCK